MLLGRSDARVAEKVAALAPEAHTGRRVFS
jgi:hypothetical protein